MEKGVGGETGNDGRRKKNTIYDRRKDQHITFLLHAPLIFSAIREHSRFPSPPFPLNALV
jgi:hypothetical protein